MKIVFAFIFLLINSYLRQDAGSLDEYGTPSFIMGETIDKAKNKKKEKKRIKQCNKC